MSRELADGLAVTAMTVRMEVSIHATAGSFALSRQRARRPPRLEREFHMYMYIIPFYTNKDGHNYN